MLNIDLARTIRVHEGHEGGAFKPKRAAHWRGTLADYWTLNPTLSLVDMRDLVAALDRDGHQNIGGGPARMPYVVRPDAR